MPKTTEEKLTLMFNDTLPNLFGRDPLQEQPILRYYRIYFERAAVTLFYDLNKYRADLSYRERASWWTRLFNPFYYGITLMDKSQIASRIRICENLKDKTRAVIAACHECIKSEKHKNYRQAKINYNRAVDQLITTARDTYYHSPKGMLKTAISKWAQLALDSRAIVDDPNVEIPDDDIYEDSSIEANSPTRPNPNPSPTIEEPAEVIIVPAYPKPQDPIQEAPAPIIDFGYGRNPNPPTPYPELEELEKEIPKKKHQPAF